MKKTLEDLFNKADALHTVSMDETLTEEATDEAYGLYWEVLEEIAEHLTKITKGEIDHQTGLKMAVHKRAEIMDLIGRLK